jgi:murein DD-endopeptidase MepM/ murein hydrolase activator NlpD
MRPGQSGPVLDVRKFRGLLDWPSDGEVLEGFGTAIHPRFKTRVPHPGLDLEGDFSTGIRSIFDGTVVFAEWMRGYGLTAIVDHGGGVLSVYAHASVLLVEPGENVVRGQTLGRVGETGSLRGPYLYFELRVDGKPADPVTWLRPREG